MGETKAPRAHFALFGFPVRVQPFFWLVALVLGASGLGSTWTADALLRVGIWIFVLFVSILWHELGHAFAMRRFGFEPWIVLHGMGGATAWGRGPERPSATARIVVSLAGPFAGFALGGAVWGVALALGEDPGRHWAITELGQMMIWVNVGWGACNLVPMLPWDGGMALHGLLDLVTKGKGLKPTGVITIITALALAGLILMTIGLELWPLFLCGLSLMQGVNVLRKPKVAASNPVPVPRVSDDPAVAIEQAQAALTQAGDARALTSAILRGSNSDAWTAVARPLVEVIAPQCTSTGQRAVALELAAWAHLLGGEPAAAQTAAAHMRPSHDPSPILAALIATQTQQHEAALEAVKEIEEEEGAARRRIEAWALTHLGRFEEALEAIGDDREAGAFVDAAVFMAERYDSAAQLGALLFKRFGDAEDAYNTACSHSRAGRPSEGLSWLENAVDAGYSDLEHLETDQDLSDVRALAGYADLRARLA